MVRNYGENVGDGEVLISEIYLYCTVPLTQLSLGNYSRGGQDGGMRNTLFKSERQSMKNRIFQQERAPLRVVSSR